LLHISLQLRCSEQDIHQDILLQIYHSLLYIFIFLGRILWQQHFSEEDTTRMLLKRKQEDDAAYRRVKRTRVMQLEATGESAGSLGNSTSSAHSDLPLNG
jgi:hypothetical protein